MCVGKEEVKEMEEIKQIQDIQDSVIMRQLTPINQYGLENVNARQFNVNKFLGEHFLNSV